MPINEKLRLSFDLEADPPKFLLGGFIALEVDGRLAIGVFKENGQDYAYFRLTKFQLEQALKAINSIEGRVDSRDSDPSKEVVFRDHNC